MLALAAAAETMHDAHFEDADPDPSDLANMIKRAKKKRCGECVGCTTEIDCNQCKYCLDKPKMGGNNTLRRQCINRMCANKPSGSLVVEDADVSAYTQECLSRALAHGEAMVAPSTKEDDGSKGQRGSREAPSIDGLPPPPIGKRSYTKSAPGRPTHTPYQKAVMARFYEFNKMPDTEEREALGKALGLTPRAVQVWFQNRRQRLKEAKEAKEARATTQMPQALQGWVPSAVLPPPAAAPSAPTAMAIEQTPPSKMLGRPLLPQYDLGRMRHATMPATTMPTMPATTMPATTVPMQSIAAPAMPFVSLASTLPPTLRAAAAAPAASGSSTSLASLATASAMDTGVAFAQAAARHTGVSPFSSAWEPARVAGTSSAANHAEANEALARALRHAPQPITVPPLAVPPLAVSPLAVSPPPPLGAVTLPVVPPTLDSLHALMQGVAAASPLSAPAAPPPATAAPGAPPVTDGGYSAVLLEAYANLPLTSRSALPRHVTGIILDAYSRMPLAQRAALPPHVTEFVDAEMRASQMRGLGLAAAREALTLQAQNLQAATARYEAALAWESGTAPSVLTADALLTAAGRAPAAGYTSAPAAAAAVATFPVHVVEQEESEGSESLSME